ncbi:hypothetical protein COW91_02830 [Candidatus Nomurabacteria bacterium CG22_combo_CG10-13_8_21_14_all_32_8]|uniref:Type II secretion system protein GspH n=2 Tax=Candidatus Nomuraibacteriota TaxID=1752729 RepID=A0A2H0CHI3_9BACT|nr:MAG: hypothetical protein COW91_02830 [Candidatus Nomurabacteria bacterium CG22_combo_CG10-13_8_21_14_all_32_8]PIZ85957.1 MAG: hypothetical protein COX94_01415 [Candidatus Nomurabacteria bacterium CG_4_10_14_0_2_um_filter_33_9]
MISFLKKLKVYKLKAISYPSSKVKLTTGHGKLNRGMTYVELIVVLSIFSIMTSIVLFNYKGFQAKVDIKVLANDIALKIVEAQKSSISGKLNIHASVDWKPSYGLYFDLQGILFGGNNKQFIYFADLYPLLTPDRQYSDGDFCSSVDSPDVECLDRIDITKGNFISQIEGYSGSSLTTIKDPLSITFKRPDSSAVFFSNDPDINKYDYIQITISSSGSSPSKAYIKVYPSGRIQID